MEILNGPILGKRNEAQFLRIWILATGAPIAFHWFIVFYAGDQISRSGWGYYATFIANGLVLGWTQWLALRGIPGIGKWWIIASGLGGLAVRLILLGVFILGAAFFLAVDMHSPLFKFLFACMPFIICFLGGVLLGIPQSLVGPRELIPRRLWVVACGLGGAASSVAFYSPVTGGGFPYFLFTALIAGLGMSVATGIALLIANERAKRAVC